MSTVTEQTISVGDHVKFHTTVVGIYEGVVVNTILDPIDGIVAVIRDYNEKSAGARGWDGLRCIAYTEWYSPIKSLVKFISEILPVPESQTHHHMCGLDPEYIDADKYKSFMRELQT